ncbi:hypothetical protein [Bacillus mesophilum]|uniref:Uncharacterized protein n=1 Tax=Bacillus mesophilum TaxID=1071718 RepID=A0A7V7UUD0_9BACI|nr:hypothetical protein [Bacillus mesophilum]KAB2331021.1 hypothetical protein F7732_17580 [Bacillus mesophilum]
MKKILIVFLSIFTLLCPSLGSAFAQSGGEGHHHGHHFMDKELVDSLMNKGFSKEEIYKASFIAKFSQAKVEDVLASYKKNGSSWDKTAQQFGVDLQKMKQHYKAKGRFLKKHQTEVLKTLSVYTGKSEADLEALIKKENMSLHFIITAAAMSKSSGKDFNDIIQLKKDGKSFQEMKEKLNLTDDKLHQEMKTLMGEIKNSIKEE